MGDATCLFCGSKFTEYASAGPVERMWTSRLYWRLFGRWPRSVANERLDYAEWRAFDLRLHLLGCPWVIEGVAA